MASGEAPPAVMTIEDEDIGGVKKPAVGRPKKEKVSSMIVFSTTFDESFPFAFISV